MEVKCNGISFPLDYAVSRDMVLDNPNEVIACLIDELEELKDDFNSIQERGDIEHDKVCQVREIIESANDSHDKATDKAVDALLDIIRFMTDLDNQDDLDVLEDKIHDTIAQAMVRYFEDIEGYINV